MKIATDILKKNFVKIFILSLMIVLPVYLVREVFIMPLMPAEISSTDTKLLWYLLSILLLNFFILLFDIGVIKITLNTLQSESQSISEIMDFSMRLWPKAIITSFLYSISVAFGMLLCFLPGIILFIAYFFNQIVLVKTGLWGRKCLFVSHLYSKVNMLKISVIILVTVVIEYIVSSGVTYLQSILPSAEISCVAGVVLFWLLQSAFSIIDIYFTVYVCNIKVDFDMNLTQKKSENNAQY